MNIPKLNLEEIRQSSSPEKENFEKEKTIYATTKNNYSTQTKNRISNRKFNAPHNLGRARELPQDWVKIIVYMIKMIKRAIIRINPDFLIIFFRTENPTGPDIPYIS